MSSAGDKVFMATIVVIASVAIAYSIWFLVMYRCVQEESYPCSYTHCAFHDTKGNCVFWTTEESTCSRCVQWEKR